jgi:hypothetical protein
MRNGPSYQWMIANLKKSLDLEDLDLISKILKLPFDNGSDNDLRASLLSLWHLIEPLENIKPSGDNILEDLMNSICDYYHLNRQYETTISERLRGIEKPNDRYLFQDFRVPSFGTEGKLEFLKFLNGEH